MGRMTLARSWTLAFVLAATLLPIPHGAAMPLESPASHCIIPDVEVRGSVVHKAVPECDAPALRFNWSANATGGDGEIVVYVSKPSADVASACSLVDPVLKLVKDVGCS